MRILGLFSVWRYENGLRIVDSGASVVRDGKTSLRPETRCRAPADDMFLRSSVSEILNRQGESSSISEYISLDFALEAQLLTLYTITAKLLHRFPEAVSVCSTSALPVPNKLRLEVPCADDRGIIPALVEDVDKI